MEFRAKVTRVLPAYKDLISDYLGMAQIILGFVTLILSIAGFIIRSFTSATSMGVMASILLNITGILGVISGIKKEVWAVSMYFGFSVITMVISLVLFMAAITAIGYEASRESPTSVTARESLDICMVVLGLLCGSTCICSILLTGVPLFTDSCKCAKGAKYVEEPNVQYSHEDINVSSPNIGVQQSATNGTDNSQVGNDTNSVNETRHGNIRSFENPQAAESVHVNEVDLGQSDSGSFPV